MNKTKAHTRYYLESKEQVPGYSAIAAQLGWNKNVLIAWAIRKALAGDDPNKIKNNAADIGTLAHYLISCDLSGEKPDLSDCSPNDIDKAENCLIKYWDWRKGKKIEPLCCETPLVSEEYRYGGTPDFVGFIDGKAILLDYKTGSGIYPEMIIQVAAYFHLVLENKIVSAIEGWIILNIPKDEKSGFIERHLARPEIEAGWQVFEHLLAIYNLKNRLK